MNADKFGTASSAFICVHPRLNIPCYLRTHTLPKS